MAFSNVSIQNVKAMAREQLGGLDGVEGFGVGDRVLRIYVRDSTVRDRLPQTFQGVAVEIVVVGDVAGQR